MFEGVNQQEGVHIHVEVWLGAVVVVSLRVSVEELARRRSLLLGNDTTVLVDLEVWMETQHGMIRVDVRREAVEVEPVLFVGDAPIEHLELVALEWSGLVSVAVEKLDDDTLLPYIGDAEAVV